MSSVWVLSGHMTGCLMAQIPPLIAFPTLPAAEAEAKRLRGLHAYREATFFGRDMTYSEEKVQILLSDAWEAANGIERLFDEYRVTEVPLRAREQTHNEHDPRRPSADPASTGGAPDHPRGNGFQDHG